MSTNVTLPHTCEQKGCGTPAQFLLTTNIGRVEVCFTHALPIVRHEELCWGIQELVTAEG